MGSSDLAPRELPPWLQQQRQNGGQQAGSVPSPSSYSLSQDASGDLKDAKDVKSTSPEDSKKLEEVCACHVLGKPIADVKGIKVVSRERRRHPFSTSLRF